MASERSPILPSTARPRAAHPRRRRLAFLVAGAVALVALVVVAVRVARSSSPSTITSTGSGFTPTVVFPADANGHRDLLPFCEEKYITQNLNQFVAGGEGTYEQRYFVCGKQFFNTDNGTIFFYNGNEADVLLYLNNTGLMWENAEEFNAVLVFAEHRYFGKSMPFGDEATQHMQYLSSTQALADYAVLIQALKDEWKADVPVIGFGGSYGGMLGTWFRIKYPHLMDGVIAASAPVLAFFNDPDHEVDSEAAMRITTFDMSPAAGSSDNCISNVRNAITILTRLSETAAGRQTIAEEIRMCNPELLTRPEDAQALIFSALGAFGNLAMGNYPYPSRYITAGAAELPGYPVRAACEHLAPNFGSDDKAVIAALRDAVGVLYNATGDMPCYFPAAPPTNSNQSVIDIANFWGYIECSELYMPSNTDGVHDVFPPTPLNVSHDDENCMATWGVHLRPNWAQTEYGGLKAIRSSSNIVFTNGNYDPWSGTGVLESQSDSVVAILIEGSAHHTDLFFSHPLDPPSLTEARQIQKQHMHKWVNQYYERKTSSLKA